MRSIRQARLAVGGLLVVCLAAALAGCQSGPPRGEVRGKVTFKGKAVSEGTVIFINPTGGGSGEAELDKDGNFMMQGGLVVGDYIVMVTPPLIWDKSDPHTPAAQVEKPAPNIPEKYRRQGSSPFKATVKPGKNEPYTFDMKP